MCCRLAAKDSSHRIGVTEEAVLTLFLLAHPCASVLLTCLWMCAKGAILVAKIRSCMSSAPRSRSFIVTSLVQLEEDTMRAWVTREKGDSQKKYWLSGSWNNPPIPYPDASEVPIHAVGKGCNSRSWEGRLARL